MTDAVDGQQVESRHAGSESFTGSQLKVNERVALFTSTHNEDSPC